MAREQRDGGHQLPQQAEDGADVERQRLALGHVEDLREPPAGHAIGDEEQRIRRGPIESADPGEVGVTRARPDARRARPALAANSGASTSAVSNDRISTASKVLLRSRR